MPKGGREVKEAIKEEARQHPLLEPMFNVAPTAAEKTQWARDVDWETNEFQIKLLELVNMFPTMRAEALRKIGMANLQERGRALIRANYRPLDLDLERATVFQGILSVYIFLP
jgi:hypothetical protein